MTTSPRPATAPVPLDLDALAQVVGGSSFPTLATPGEEGLKLYGRLGDDVMNGTKCDDLLSGGLGDDQLYGHGGNNSMDGGAGADTIHGGDNWELLDGSGGNDLLLGGGGEDSLLGRTGNDTLVGGQGDDTMIGGWGSDKFIIDANDWRTTDAVHGHHENTAVGEWLSRHDHDQIQIINANWAQVQITFTSGGFSGSVGPDGVQKLQTNSAGIITFGDQTVTFRGIESIKVGR